MLAQFTIFDGEKEIYLQINGGVVTLHEQHSLSMRMHGCTIAANSSLSDVVDPQRREILKASQCFVKDLLEILNAQLPIDTTTELAWGRLK